MIFQNTSNPSKILFLPNLVQWKLPRPLSIWIIGGFGKSMILFVEKHILEIQSKSKNGKDETKYGRVFSRLWKKC